MSFGNNVYNTLNGNSGTSFTPGISIDSQTTGITYSQQQGSYHRLGNMVYFQIYVTLSSKGAVAGQVRITGLPFAPNGNQYFYQLFFSNVSLPAGAIGLYAQTQGTSTSLIIYGLRDNAGVTSVLDTNFNNNSQVGVTGFYFV